MKAALGSVKSKVTKTKKHDNIDVEFEELRTKFDEIAKSQAVVYKNLKKQDVALAALGEQTLALAEVFHGLNGSQDNPLSNDYRTTVASFVQLLNHNKEDCATAFAEVETHKAKRKEVKKSIQARDTELTAYEVAAKDNESLKAKVPPVTDKLLIAAASREETHTAAYEAANSKALSELKEFVDNRSAHFDSHVNTILAAQTNLFKSAHTQLTQVIGSEEYQKIGVPEEAKSIPEAFSPKPVAKARRNSKPQPPLPALKLATQPEGAVKLPTISESPKSTSDAKPDVATTTTKSTVELKATPPEVKSSTSKIYGSRAAPAKDSPKPTPDKPNPETAVASTKSPAELVVKSPEAKPSTSKIYGKPPVAAIAKDSPKPTNEKQVPEEKAKPTVVRSPGKLAAAAMFEAPVAKESPKPKAEPKPFKLPTAKSPDPTKPEVVPAKSVVVAAPESETKKPNRLSTGPTKPVVSPKTLEKSPSSKEAAKEDLPKKEESKEEEEEAKTDGIKKDEPKVEVIKEEPKTEEAKEEPKKEEAKEEPQKEEAKEVDAEAKVSVAETINKDEVDAEIDEFVNVANDDEEEGEEEEDVVSSVNFSDLEATKTERLTRAQRAKKRKTRPPTKGKPIAFAVETKEVIEKVPERTGDDEDRPQPEKPKMPMGMMGMKGFQLPAIMPGKGGLRSVAKSAPELSKDSPPEKPAPALPKLNPVADKSALKPAADKPAPKPAADSKPALPILKPASPGGLKPPVTESAAKSRPASMAVSSPSQPSELKTTAKPRPLSAKLSAPVIPEAKEGLKPFMILKKTASEPNASKPESMDSLKASDAAKPPSKPPPPKPEAKSPGAKQAPPRPSRT